MRKKRNKEAEAEQEEFQLLRKILQKIPSGIYIYEPAVQVIEYSNMVLATQLGYTREDSDQFGENFFVKVCHPYDLKDFNAKLIAYGRSNFGQAYEHDLRMKHKDGSWRWMHTINILYSKPSDQRWMFLGSAQDITARRQMDDELTRAKLEAEKANSVKTAFLRNLSHHLRTPMNAVYGFATLLEEKELPMSVAQNYLGIIRKNSETLLNLINSLIDISLLETHQLPLFPQKFYLNSFFNNLKDELLRSLEFMEKNQVVLSVHPLPESVSDEFFYDRTRLQQIFSILLNNSIRHTARGKISFGYHSSSEKWFTFFASDTGSGISQEKQSTVFEPFHSSETGAEKGIGPGLGLAICSRLVSLTKGRIWFSSKANEGTTFWFTLPRTGLQNIEGITRGHTLMLDCDLQGIRVLIVDDNAESRLYYKEVLEAKGMIVYEATTLKEALKILLTEPAIRIVLLDIFLPDGNGLDLVIRIKERKKDLRIIAQTAYASEEDRTKCFGAGCDDYLAKPIGREELVFRIALHLKGIQRNGIFSGRFVQVPRNQKV